MGGTLQKLVILAGGVGSGGNIDLLGVEAPPLAECKQLCPSLWQRKRTKYRHETPWRFHQKYRQEGRQKFVKFQYYE